MEVHGTYWTANLSCAAEPSPFLPDKEDRLNLSFLPPHMNIATPANLLNIYKAPGMIIVSGLLTLILDAPDRAVVRSERV
jgi:hypothetical protein